MKYSIPFELNFLESFLITYQLHMKVDQSPICKCYQEDDPIKIIY